MGKEFYVSLWKKYLPIIKLLLKKVDNGPQELKLSKYEFVAAGGRADENWRFNLELTNGKLSNNIKGSAVARNLEMVLTDSVDTRPLLLGKKVKINMDNDFVLKIQKL